MSAGNQEVAQPGEAVLSGRVERGEAAVLGLVRIRAVLDQQARDGFVAGRDGTMEGLDPDAAGGPGVRVGTAIEELLHGAQPAEVGRQVERRETVAGTLVDRLRIGLVEQLGEPAQVAHDCRLEAIQVGLRSQHALEDRRLPLVRGHRHRREAWRVARAREEWPLSQQPVDGRQVARADRAEQLVGRSHPATVAATRPELRPCPWPRQPRRTASLSLAG